MAGITDIIRQNMVDRFTHRIGAVMTTDAITNEGGMVGHATWREPAIGIVARIAFRRGWRMVGSFASCQRAVMTT